MKVQRVPEPASYAVAAHVVVISEHGVSAIVGADWRERLKNRLQFGVRITTAVDEVARQEQEIGFQFGKLLQHAHPP